MVFEIVVGEEVLDGPEIVTPTKWLIGIGKRVEVILNRNHELWRE